ncbi:sialate O-acetylesterase [Wenyingzhuangia sp. IMCC45574]
MKKRHVFLIAVICSFICGAGLVPNTATAVKENEVVHVVLLAGQSNMAGGGNYDELDAATKERTEKVSNRVWVSQSNTEQKPLSYFKNRPSKKYNFTKRFGPELFVGLTLAEANPDKKYLLIKEAKGGTALYGAWNPDWSAEKAKLIEKGERKQSWNLCEIHMSSIKENLKLLQKKGYAYKVVGMAWMQGENDGLLDVSADSYEENLNKLIAKYRKEFAAEKMPFVYGQINSRYGVKDGAKRVRSAMERVQNTANAISMIQTQVGPPWDDYPKHSDNVHYNTEGQKRLGIAFAKELIRLKKH